MVTLQQIRAARAMLGLKQQELAQKAGVSVGTLNNIERGVQTDPKSSTLRAIQKALEAEGVKFTQGDNGELGICLKPTPTKAGHIPLLIIDDSPADRILYKNWLTKNSVLAYDVLEADNAAKGYEAFLQHKPACILLDFMMYGMNGFQLLLKMKHAEIFIPPIIFVTAMHDESLKKNVMELGVDGYLDKKTLTREVLNETVTKALVYQF